MKFRIRGAKRSLEDKLPALARRIIDVLDKLPDGELIEGNRELAGELKHSHTNISMLAPHRALLAYRAKHPRGVLMLWGNKKTIAAFRKRFPVK